MFTRDGGLVNSSAEPRSGCPDQFVASGHGVDCEHGPRSGVVCPEPADVVAPAPDCHGLLRRIARLPIRRSAAAARSDRRRGRLRTSPVQFMRCSTLGWSIKQLSETLAQVVDDTFPSRRRSHPAVRRGLRYCAARGSWRGDSVRFDERRPARNRASATAPGGSRRTAHRRQREVRWRTERQCRRRRPGACRS